MNLNKNSLKIFVGVLIAFVMVMAVTGISYGANIKQVAHDSNAVVKLFTDGTAKVYLATNVVGNYAEVTKAYSTSDGMNYTARNLTTADLSGIQSVTMLSYPFGSFLFLKTDGTVVQWMLNTINMKLGTTGYEISQAATNVSSIVTGPNNTVLLTKSGTIVVFFVSMMPGSVPSTITNSNIKQVVAGYNFILVLKNDGTVQAGGTTTKGALAIPSGLNNVKMITAGYHHVIAIKNDGTIVKWGDNSLGQFNNIPAKVDLTTILSMSAKTHDTVVTKKDGNLLAWGQNATYFNLKATTISGVVNPADLATYGGSMPALIAIKSTEAVIVSNYPMLPISNVPGVKFQK